MLSIICHSERARPSAEPAAAGDARRSASRGIPTRSVLPAIGIPRLDLGSPRSAKRDSGSSASLGMARLDRWVQACGVILLATLLLGASDQAARFDKLGHNMICGCGCRQILLECNHVGCQVSDKMVRELRVALTRGDSDDLVMQAFVQRYGETVRAAPEAKGFNLMAWITPFAMLLAGLLLAVTVLRRWSMRPAAAAAPGAPAAQLEALRHKARQETEL